MNPIVRNILAVVAGWLIGSFINVALVNLGPSIIALPEGADISTMENLKESMQFFKPANFLFPFLGHAVGTLVGAFTAAKIAISHNKKIALGMGAIFFMGGVAAVFMLGGPTWFKALDLIFAYFPMAFLGSMLAKA